VIVGELAVRTPFPWHHLLDYLSHRLIPEVERVEDARYLRKYGKRIVAVSFDAGTLQVTADGRVKSEDVLERVAKLFDVEHSSTPVARHLRRSPIIAARMAQVPGFRPLGAWSGFELCVRTVLGQQVTVAAARTLMQRLVQRCGSITAECVLAADLANMGMPGRRVETLRGLARAVEAGHVRFDRPWQQVEAALQQLPGFGPWTRSYLAIRLGRVADAFPETDLGLIRAAGADSAAALLSMSQAWRPYRAYAATYLWAVNADLR
jgi:DNA-3-methyladenine glycosylase II